MKRTVFEIRLHARAGQGAKTAAQFIAEAALLSGKYVQAFPSYGPEREGAPVKAFVRISDQPINIHSQVYDPEAAIVIDDGLIEFEGVCAKLDENEFLLINTKMKPDEVRKKLACPTRIFTLDASKIAKKILGKDIPNTVLLGAFVKISKLIRLKDLLFVVKKKFMEKYGREIAEANVKAAKEGYKTELKI